MIFQACEIPAAELASPPVKCPVLIGFRMLGAESDSRRDLDRVEVWIVYAVHQGESEDRSNELSR